MSTPYSSANSPYGYSPVNVSTPLPSLTPNNLNNNNQNQQQQQQQINRYTNPPPNSNSPKPIPIPLLQRTRHPSQAQSTKNSNTTGIVGNLVIEDTILEAKKVCALLLGVGGGGLLTELEMGLINAVKRRDNTFGDSDENAKGPPIEILLNNLSSLIQILRTSPLGGLTISNEQTGEIAELPINLGNLIEKKSVEVQRLFKERQRAREGAEIAGSVLGSS